LGYITIAGLELHKKGQACFLTPNGFPAALGCATKAEKQTAQLARKYYYYIFGSLENTATTFLAFVRFETGRNNAMTPCQNPRIDDRSMNYIRIFVHATNPRRYI
jgi:hypothetical protein